MGQEGAATEFHQRGIHSKDKGKPSKGLRS